MIEVFKTNITSSEEAQNIVSSIHLAFAGYKANFDLFLLFYDDLFTG